MKEIVFLIIIAAISIDLACSQEEQRIKRYENCDVSIFSVPRFILENYLLAIPYMVEKIIRDEVAYPDVYFALPILWLFIAPINAIWGIIQFYHCLTNGHLRLNEFNLIKNGENP